MAVTLKDIARAAGVNMSTVSRSLNDSYGVNPETRDRVLEVARRLNYHPNRVARGLATGFSRTFGLVISDIRNPFFAELARGAEDAANAAGCDLILCNSDLNPDKQMRYVRSLIGKRVDGILMNSVASLSANEQSELSSAGIPIVLLNRAGNSQAFSTVMADNFQGGQIAAEHLVRLGHKRVAHLTGARQHGNLTERAKGFLKSCPDAHVLYGEHTYSGGYDLTNKLLEKHPRVTAIFAANDAIAFGAIRAIIDRGLSVPDDLSIVGFDNVEFSSIIHPPLTTVHQPKYEMGEAAVEILAKSAYRANGHANGVAPEHRLLGVHLIERQSCRKV